MTIDEEVERIKYHLLRNDPPIDRNHRTGLEVRALILADVYRKTLQFDKAKALGEWYSVYIDEKMEGYL